MANYKIPGLMLVVLCVRLQAAGIKIDSGG